MLYELRSRERARNLVRLVQLAVRRYNRYRGVESRAEVLRIDGDTVMVKFTGYFCETCGINDWVDDFRYVIEDLGGEAELVKVIEPSNPDEYLEYRIGVFRIRRVPDTETLDRLEREEQELEEMYAAATEG